MRPRALHRLAILALAASLARAERFGELDVVQMPPDPGETVFGYAEHRFRVANDGAQPRAVTIELSSTAGPGVTLRRTVVVGPRSAAVVALWQPALPMSHVPHAEVFSDARRVGRLELGNPYFPHGGYYWRSDSPLVLTGRSLDAPRLEARFAPPAPPTPPGEIPPTPQPTVRFARAEQAVGAWSPHWLAYSRYDGVALSVEEYRGAPDGVRDALRRYAEAGGALLIFGATPPDAARAGERLRTQPVGFGAILYGRDADAAAYDDMEIREIKARLETYRQSDQWRRRLSLDNLPALRGAFAGGIPFRTIFLLMLGFGVLIGPLNLIYAHRRRRPAQLLWTTPALSFAATALLFAWGLLSEGTTPSARLESLTLLDQSERRAATLGLIAWYCPIAPAGGLRFSGDTEIEIAGDRERGGCVVDWTRDQHLARGWVSARTPAAVYARKVEPRRERLRVAREGDRLRVVNGLGADIASLWLADRDGRIHQGVRIPAGAEALLDLRGLRATASPRYTGFYCLGGEPWAAAWETLTNDPAAALRPGEYLALLDDSPFLETGLEGRLKAQRRARVLGVFGPEDLP